MGEILTRGGKPKQGVEEFGRRSPSRTRASTSSRPSGTTRSGHSLGAALLKAGQGAEAEAVYREDLKRFPENGWSLFGLGNGARSQQKTSEAEDVERRFKQAWAGADVTLGRHASSSA
jgi:hypothetical protein